MFERALLLLKLYGFMVKVIPRSGRQSNDVKLIMNNCVASSQCKNNKIFELVS